MLQKIHEHACYKYAIDVIEEKVEAGIYIKKACKNFIEMVDNEESKYFVDIDEVEMITNLTKIINMSTGLMVGKPCYNSLAGFQWFFIVNALCVKYKDNPNKRRFEKSVLLIGRKSGKSFLIGLIFILLMLIEPEFSELYSVAPDRELSSIIKKEIEQTLQASPHIRKHFKILRSNVECEITKNKFTPLAYSENRMDGRMAAAWCADEVGALKTRGPIDAMQSSQMNMVNRTGILISTAYETTSNPMTEEVEYAKKVLDEIIEDETLFALLYEPDDKKDWMSDKTMLQANPLCYTVPSNTEYLKQQRNRAMEMESAKKNFLTKHLNIFVDGDETELYVSADELKKRRLEEYDWYGKEVFVGVDLSQTTDNTAIAMTTYDYELEKYVTQVWAFAPEGNIENKSKLEKVDYHRMKEKGNIFLVGDKVIDYKFVEEFVLKLEENYGVNIIAIGYDRYNCISSANKWEDEGYEVIEIKQHSSVLHPATKLTKECILEDRFAYVYNELLEINFMNARETSDTNLNTYITKKKSIGKVDMVVALLNSMVLWCKEHEEGIRNTYEDHGLTTL